MASQRSALLEPLAALQELTPLAAMQVGGAGGDATSGGAGGVVVLQSRCVCLVESVLPG